MIRKIDATLSNIEGAVSTLRSKPHEKGTLTGFFRMNHPGAKFSMEYGVDVLLRTDGTLKIEAYQYKFGSHREILVDLDIKSDQEAEEIV